jgi:hypothetical protein
MGENGNEYKVSVENLRERDHGKIYMEMGE